MPFALIIVGLVMVVAAVRGTHVCLVNVVKSEFQGQGNFTYWIVAILLFGVIGYSDTLRPVSNALLVLIILALFLTKARNGLFSQFQSALGGGTAQTTTTGVINTLTGG